ncbi:MAG: ATP-binding protein [Desulfobacterales bacterium]|nr:ATP-binding protein [Desulfobacterales bacterium]
MVKAIKNKAVQKETLHPLELLVSTVAHEIKNLNNCTTFNTPILREYLERLVPIIDDYAKNHHDLDLFGMSYPEFRKDIFNLVNNLDLASSRINDIISDLMEFVRNGYKGEQCWVDLNQVIEKSVAICRSQINKRVKSFDVNIVDNLPPVYTDPVALEQILINFLINAVQASDKENSWLKLSIRQGEGMWRNHLIIEVSDNGCGIDNAACKKIFDPFFTTKASGKGTGLGLFISKNLAEVLGARIEVETNPGKGSSFSIILPRENHNNIKNCSKSKAPTFAGFCGFSYGDTLT